MEHSLYIRGSGGGGGGLDTILMSMNCSSIERM
jgi:hypothetical protein